MRTVLASTAAVLALVAAAPAGAASGDSAAQMRAIVRAWSTRLNADDNKGIARLFAVPATVIQAPYVYRLRSSHDVALWFSGLPCAGMITSIAVSGRYATAVFRLANRGSSACDAPGTLAAARFEIVHGKIVAWAQVAVPKAASPNPNVI